MERCRHAQPSASLESEAGSADRAGSLQARWFLQRGLGCKVACHDPGILVSKKFPIQRPSVSGK